MNQSTTDIREILAQELGFPGLDSLERDMLIGESTEVVLQGVMLRIFEELDEAARTELGRCIEEVNDTAEKAQQAQDAMSAFLKAHAPNFEELVRDEIAQFKEKTEAALKEQ